MSILSTLAKRALPNRVVERLGDFRYAGFPQPFRTVRPHTLLSNLNLFFLQELTRRIEAAGVVGNFVECGVYRGGSAGVLGHALISSQLRRELWLFDAFEGMPRAGEQDDDFSRSIEGEFVGSEESTRRILDRLGVDLTQYKIQRGWFSDTLPAVPEFPIALLHVDSDFYDPVKIVLETFFSRVVPGGFVVLNDYGSFEGCRKATDEFLARAAPEASLIQVDCDAYYLQK